MHLVRVCSFLKGQGKGDVCMNLKEILLKRFKEEIEKENYFWDTTRQLNPTREHPRLKGTVLVSFY